MANSRKTSGRCIAGKEVANGVYGPWIRPVSSRPTAELSEYERRYENGRDPRVLDIVRVPMMEPRPHGFQTENHLIDPDKYWTSQGAATWADARNALDPLGPLWDNASSSYNGLHDRVNEQLANPLNGSLRLIRVGDFVINVVTEGEEFGNGKRRLRGQFSHLGVHHLLSITDPVTERTYYAGQNGSFHVGDAILCVSLGEPYQGYAYKLVASVLLPL